MFEHFSIYQVLNQNMFIKPWPKPNQILNTLTGTTGKWGENYKYFNISMVYISLCPCQCLFWWFCWIWYLSIYFPQLQLYTKSEFIKCRARPVESCSVFTFIMRAVPPPLHYQLVCCSKWDTECTHRTFLLFFLSLVSQLIMAVWLSMAYNNGCTFY